MLVCLMVDSLVGLLIVSFVGLWLILWSVGRLIDLLLVGWLVGSC